MGPVDSEIAYPYNMYNHEEPFQSNERPSERRGDAPKIMLTLCSPNRGRGQPEPRPAQAHAYRIRIRYRI